MSPLLVSSSPPARATPHARNDAHVTGAADAPAASAPASATAPHVGIVGGGMLGAAVALRLRDRGFRVTLIEAAPRLGGLASPQTIGDVTWDRFYHVVSLSDSYLRELLTSLGLGDRLRWATTRTGFYTRDGLYSLSSSLEFLRFPPLSLVDKARLAWTIIHASRITDGAPLEGIPATTWLERHSGKRTLERIWLPLLKAKLGDNYKRASAAFIWAIIARMYAARRSGLKRELFGYVAGGYDAILSRLHHYLVERGIDLRCGRGATAVATSGDGGGVDITIAGGQLLHVDHAVLTVPCPRVAALCPQLTLAERERLNAVVYQGVVCPSLLLERPLANYYVTNITEPSVPFTAVIEMTALVDPTTFAGRSLVYLPRYLAQQDTTWARSDADIVDESVTALEKMYPHFRRSQVIAWQVGRARDVLAVPTLDYSRTLLPPLNTSVPNVFVVNSAQIANGTLNVNETLALAARQVEALAPLMRTAAESRQ